jgi:hypothetical protein
VLRVCDRLVELYLDGGLPVGSSGEAAGLLDAYWLGRAERLPEDERRELYTRALGPGFEHLLGRLAAALAAAGPAGGGDDDVRWAAGELRATIDVHVDEPARDAVPLLHAQFGDALAILSEREILGAYGARDPWQLIDHLARLELGGTRDVARHQALAATGTVILGWLAEDGAAVTDDVVEAARTWLEASVLP